MEEVVRSWLAWRKTVEFIRHDMGQITGAPVRFPKEYALILEQFEADAKAREAAALSQLRRHDVRILGEVTDQGEHFVMWRHRGETRLTRLTEAQARLEAKKRLDEMTGKFSD